jgi:hypothetical protein
MAIVLAALMMKTSVLRKNLGNCTLALSLITIQEHPT